MATYKKQVEKYIEQSLPEKGQDWKLIYSEISNPISVEECISKYSITSLDILFTYILDPTWGKNYAIKCAVRYKRCNVIKMLMNNKNVDPGDDDNFCIQYAGVNGLAKILLILLKSPLVDPSVNSHYLLYNAIKSGYTNIVKYLIGDYRMTGANYTKARELAGDNKAILAAIPKQNKLQYEKKATESNIVYAIRLSNTRLLQQLIHINNEDPSIDNNYALKYACDIGNNDVVKILLEDPRVNPNSFNNEAIKLASKRGYVDIVYTLIRHPKFNNIL